MTSYRYHVTCSKTKSKKLISASSRNRDVIIKEIKRKFSVNSEILLQKKYEVNDWVDVDTDEELPDDQKLLFLNKNISKCKILRFYDFRFTISSNTRVLGL